MFFKYVLADLSRNVSRTFAAMVGVILGVGFFTALLFFVDGLSASMSQRAIASVPIDMQHILTDPVAGNLEMRLTVDPEGPVETGAAVDVKIVVQNGSEVGAHEVTLRSAPPKGFAFLEGSARLGGETLQSGGNPFRQGATAMGLNVGTLEPGQRLELSYTVQAVEAAHVRTEDFGGSFSTREAYIPVPANQSSESEIGELAAEIAQIDGVDAAEPVALADLPAGALVAGQRSSGPVRVFGFDAGYLKLDRTVLPIAGAPETGKAMISAEAAKKLSVAPGDRIELALPSDAKVDLEVAAVLDLAGAKALFASRRGADLEAFVYVPDSVVLDFATFSEFVLPAFAAAASARGGPQTSPPIREIDIRVDRDRLDADPETALLETRAIADAVRALSGRRDFLLDNISNTLAVAAIDAMIVKRMFAFLGLPGALLAALLAAYAGLVLGGAQRRETMTLRMRGAGRRQLLKMLAFRVLFMAVVGTLFGTGLGFLSAVATLGPEAFGRVQSAMLVASGLIGGLVGTAATATALYLTGRRNIELEINAGRAEIDRRRSPLVGRRWPELWLYCAVAIGTLVAHWLSAFEGVSGSAYEGRPVNLQLWLLALPVGVWFAGTLFVGRIARVLLKRAIWPTRSDLSDHPLGLVVVQTLRRRTAPIVEAAMIVTLILSFAVGLGVFAGSYDRSKAADSRYFLGGDLRVARAPSHATEARLDDAARLESAVGVSAATPVVYGVHNSVVRSARTSELVNLAAIEPESFARTAPIDNAAFPSGSASETIGLLVSQQNAILLSTDMADFLQVEIGDPIQTLVGRGTSQQREVSLVLVGLYKRLPGFPNGVHAVISTVTLAQWIDPVVPDFITLRVEGPTYNNRSAVAASLQANSTLGPLRIETRDNVLSSDRSSIAMLNVEGLLGIDRAYATGMAAAGLVIFVFGRLLQRRREYIALRALGMMPRTIRLMIGAEVAVAVGTGVVGGCVIGVAMSVYYVGVLRPLFVLAPSWGIAESGLATLLLVTVFAAIAITVLATSVINRMEPAELLRDD